MTFLPAVLPSIDPTGDLGAWAAWVGDQTPPEGQSSLNAAATVAPGGPCLHVVCEDPRLRPLTARHDTCEVVFDGVLYGRDDLRGVLCDDRGLRPNDAELALRAYLRWGPAFLDRAKGLFALVVWDRRDGAVLGARDRMGAYPLYYVDAGPRLLLSTSLNYLLRQPDVPGTLDLGAMAAQIIHHWLDHPDTHYRSVRRLPAGHVLRAVNGERHVSRYWDPAPGDRPLRLVQRSELEHFDVLLEQAVERCLEFGPTCISLSGGLDSVSVAAVAVDVSRRRGWSPPVALSIDHTELGGKEAPIQTAVAQALGLPHVFKRLWDLADEGTVIQEAIERSASWPWPLHHPGLIHEENLAFEGRQRGCRVMLSGEGGDEWLAPHPVYGADLLRRLRLIRFYRFGAALHRSYEITLAQNVRASAWTYGLRPLLVHAAGQGLRGTVPGVLGMHRRRAILRQCPQWLAPDPAVRQAMEARITRDVERQLSVKTSRGMHWSRLRPLLNTWFDDDFERSRRMGLRYLHPYWDADLVDFLYRTPPELLTAKGRTKGPARDALGRRLPELGFDEQRKMVRRSSSVLNMVAAGAQQGWEKLGGAPMLEALGIVDARRLKEEMEAFFVKPGETGLFGSIWPLLSLEAWVRPRM